MVVSISAKWRSNAGRPTGSNQAPVGYCAATTSRLFTGFTVACGLVVAQLMLVVPVQEYQAPPLTSWIFTVFAAGLIVKLTESMLFGSVPLRL